MKFYEHQFSNVEGYLHHRAPYLLVEKIVSISANSVETEKVVSGHEFFLPGHFPGASVFPGAMLQELSTQSAGILIAAKYNPMQQYNTHDPKFNEYALGVLVQVHSAKYKTFARPGDRLRVTVTLDEHIDTVFDFSATIASGDSVVMRNRFRLTNIKSAVLWGDESRNRIPA